MKILHVLYQSFPHITGSSTRSRDILCAQMSLGVSTVVVTSPFQNGEKDVDVLFGVKHYRTFNKRIDKPTSEKDSGFISRFWRFLRFPYFVIFLASVVRKEKPDILHAHATFFCGLSAFIVGALCRKPVVYEVRSLWEQRILEQNPSVLARLQVWIISWLEGLSMKCADHVVVISSHLFQVAVSNGVPPDRISVIGNAVNLTYIEKLKASSDYDKKPFRSGSAIVFGYIGGLSAIEGLDLLIEGFGRLSAMGKDYRLIVFGGGVVEGSLRALAKSKSLANVEFRGVISSDCIAEAYKQVDVIVNPRRRLPICEIVTPLKPLEAVAFDCLFLGSDVGGIKELITDGEDGFLFEADNLESLVQAILRIVDLTELELKEFKDRAYKRLVKFRDWEYNGDKYLQLYTKLLSKK